MRLKRCFSFFQPEVCLTSRRKILAELQRNNSRLDCNLLNNLSSKTEAECQREEMEERKHFEDSETYSRLSLKHDLYFKLFATAANEQASWNRYNFIRFKLDCDLCIQTCVGVDIENKICCTYVPVLKIMIIIFALTIQKWFCTRWANLKWRLQWPSQS